MRCIPTSNFQVTGFLYMKMYIGMHLMILICHYSYYSCLCTFGPTIPTYFFNLFSCFLYLFFLVVQGVVQYIVFGMQLCAWTSLLVQSDMYNYFTCLFLVSIESEICWRLQICKVGLSPCRLLALRYFGFCNVLRIWSVQAIPTYRVYQLYDYPKEGNYNNIAIALNLDFLTIA